MASTMNLSQSGGSLDGTLNRSSKKKKKDRNHKLHVAAALMPTQAFAIAPSVRCEVPTTPGMSDMRLSRLNDTALSNSLVRRSLDKSLDQRDSEFLRSMGSSLGDTASATRRSMDPIPLAAPMDVTTKSQSGSSLRVNIEQASQSSQPIQASPNSADDMVNESVLTKRNGKPTVTYAMPPAKSASQVDVVANVHSVNVRESNSLPTFNPNAANQSIQEEVANTNRTASSPNSPVDAVPSVSPPPTGTLTRRLEKLGPATLPSNASATQRVQDAIEGNATFDEITSTDVSESDTESESEARFRPRQHSAVQRRVHRPKSSPSAASSERAPSHNAHRRLAARHSHDAARIEYYYNSNRESLDASDRNLVSHRSLGSSDTEQAAAMPSAEVDLAEMRASRAKKGNSALRNENRVLQDNVQRLSVELSRYQAAVAIQSGEVDRFLHVNKVKAALSMDEPLPLWLVDQKYLSPLFASYDALIRDKDALLRDALLRNQEFERRLQEAVKGAPPAGLFSAQLVSPAAVPGGVPANWPEIVDQCKRVIDENALLKSSKEKQNKELSEVERFHVQEVSRLNERIAVLEAEVAAEHSRFTAMVDRYHALDEVVKRTGYYGNKSDLPNDVAAYEQLESRLKEAETALTEAETKYAAVYDRAKNFAESLVRLSAENKSLQEEKTKKEKSLTKYKQRVAAMQEALVQLQTKDNEKNSLIKDLMSVTDGIAKQRNELAENLQKASSAKSQTIEEASVEKELKLKWLEAMLQNSANRADKEELERRKLEENLHAVWEAAVLRDRNRLSGSSNGSVRHERPSVRNGDYSLGSLKFD